jgi:hypothetical protein
MRTRQHVIAEIRAAESKLREEIHRHMENAQALQNELYLLTQELDHLNAIENDRTDKTYKLDQHKLFDQ